jgi:uncharacterized membrane protein
MKKLFQYFLRGLIVLAPIALTGYVFWAVFRTVEGWFDFRYPGLGLLVTLAAVTVIGFLSSHVLTRGAVALLEGMLDRLPFVRLLHTSLRDLASAVVGQGRRFDRPVLVQLAPGGARFVGFVTRDALDTLGLLGEIAVYLPQSYNFAGQLVVVRRENVQALPVASSETLAFVVSGGISGAGSGSPPRGPQRI